MRVLAAVDLAKGGFEPLVERAAWFAATMGARLDLLYVGPEPRNGDADAQDRADRERLVQALAGVPEGVRGEPSVRRGDPVQVIVAATGETDALVVGPRNPGDLGRILLGSVSEKVIRRARCGVLVPRGDVRDRAERRLLVGLNVDGPDPGWVLSQAETWARRVGGRLDAVYADPEGPPWVPDPIYRERAMKAWERGLEPKRLEVERLLERVDPAVRGRARLGSGGPENALVDLSGDYDFVLVGTRRRPGLTGYLLGSVADFVIRNSACDVLTLHTAAHLAA